MSDKEKNVFVVSGSELLPFSEEEGRYAEAKKLLMQSVLSMGSCNISNIISCNVNWPEVILGGIGGHIKTRPEHIEPEKHLKWYLYGLNTGVSVEEVCIPEKQYFESATISDRGGRDIIESERLKSQNIVQQREILALRHEKSALENQNSRLFESLCDLVKANKSLQASLLAKESGRICVHETHVGAVSEIAGDQIEVTYEIDGSPVKQVYEKRKFLYQKLPNEGDKVEAHLMIVVTKRGGKESEFTSDLPNFREKATPGPLNI